MSEKVEDGIFVAVPSYGGTVGIGVANTIAQLQRDRRVRGWQFADGSLLTHNFNRMLFAAWDHRADWQLRWFLMIHSDVVPVSEGWLDVMLTRAKEHRLAALSVVLRIKAPVGDATSTALDQREGPQRLTLRDLAQLPATFTGKDCRQAFRNDRLLINTGLMILDLEQINPSRLYFATEDRVERGKDGVWRPESVPEDWMFSRQLRKQGLRYGATLEVEADHVGLWAWRNRA